MRWPCQRAATAQSLRDELDAERERHLKDVLDLLDLTGTPALQFGNVHKVWPELLDDMLELARQSETKPRVIVVTGAGRVHGVYGVER